MLLIRYFVKSSKNDIHAKAQIWLLSDSKMANFVELRIICNTFSI